MDDYLSKPFTEDGLVAILNRWSRATHDDQGAPAVSAPMPAALPSAAPLATPPPAIDAEALARLSRMERPDRPGFVDRIVRRYLTDAPRLVQSIVDGIAAGDRQAVAVAAHTLKSSSANLGAVFVRDACAELEQLATADTEWGTLRALAAVLQSSFVDASAELSTRLQRSPNASA